MLIHGAGVLNLGCCFHGAVGVTFDALLKYQVANVIL